MATNNLSIILDLQDNASKDLRGFDGKLKDLNNTFKKIAAVGTVAFAGITAGVHKSTQEAARAEGSWNKFNTVFGEGADDMRAWIGTVRKEMPTATHEIARMSADLQDLLIPMGLSRGAAQGMTKEMVTLSNKLAAFNDVDPTEVLEAFKSGLAGSSEPLRRFGINALDSSIELEALQTGLLKAGQGFKDLDPITRSQVRAQAMVSLAYKQSGDAIDGFEANNDSLIRRQQALRATFAELAVTLGNTFLPIIDSLVKKILPVIQAIGAWTEANPILTRNIVIVSAALAGLVAVIGLLGVALLSMKAATVLGVGAFLVMAAPVLAIIAGLAALGVAVYYFYSNFGNVVTFIKDLFIGLGNFFANWWTGLGDSTQGWLLLVGNILTGGLLGWVRLFIANFDTIKAVFASLFANMKDGFAITWDSITDIFKKAIDFIMKLMQPLLRALDRLKEGASIVGGSIKGGIGKAKSGIGGLLNSGGNFLKRTMSVNDAIISPDGNIITTHPDDYLIATKNPQSLAGGGGFVINITGNSFMGEDDMAEKIGNKLMSIVKLNAQV